MPTRAQLLALTEELRRRKAGGERSVTVSSETLAQLRDAVEVCRAGSLEPQQNHAASVATVAPLVAPDAPPPRVVAKVAPSAPAAPSSIPSAPPTVVLPPGDKATRWAALRELVMNDPVCRGHVRSGKKIVLGTGNLDAALFFCGEAPGAEEEIQGEPFVGPAGQLLTRMIVGMGLRRDQVYIGNIMNWRPEMPAGPAGVQVGNRPPTAEEMNYCLPYLRAQLEIVQPQLIVALGATAAGGLLGAGTFKTLGEIKGRWHQFADKPVMVTYHPSYILRNNSNRSKRGIWEDLLQVMDRAGLPVTPQQRSYFI